jgi:hypothetical protein
VWLGGNRRDTRLVLEEVWLFDFEHPAESSAPLATEVESLRSEIRQTNKLGTAITAMSNFTVSNSAAKGQTFVNQMSRIMLRAYNAEAENAAMTVKAGNLASAQNRLSTAREQVAKHPSSVVWFDGDALAALPAQRAGRDPSAIGGAHAHTL